MKILDMETQIASNVIKRGLLDFEDTQRCPNIAMDFSNNVKKPSPKIALEIFKKNIQTTNLNFILEDSPLVNSPFQHTTQENSKNHHFIAQYQLGTASPTTYPRIPSTAIKPNIRTTL